MHIKYFLISSVSLCFSACGNNTNTNNRIIQDETPDVLIDVSIDTDSASDQVADINPDQASCERLTECSQGSCGEVDDQCGGFIDCGACACSDGQPTGDGTCGPCGLGRLDCSDESSVCVLPNLGGINISSCDALIFVDSEAVANGSGAKDSPFSSIAEAGASRRLDDETVFVLSHGEHEVSQPLSMTNGHHIIGGYARGSWFFEPTQATKITYSISTGDRTRPALALNASDITEPTVLAYVSLLASTSVPGQNIYGMRASNASSLILSNISVRSETTVSGLDGFSGSDGAPGSDGLDAPKPSYQSFAIKGDAGLNLSCPSANGGDGGLGAHSPLNSGQIVSSSVGVSSGASRGGRAGSEFNKAGGNGDSGFDPPRADDGVAATPIVQILNGFLDAKVRDGNDGIAGRDGQGGGGGGGGWWESSPGPEEKAGSSGGGGASGGCGGTGGTGGQAGGSSVGLLILDTSGLKIIDSTFTSTDGADGGIGGRGGVGGEGGEGGDPTKESTLVIFDQGSGLTTRNIYSTLRNAGKGGNGSNGSNGGNGSSGVGGSSYGVFCGVSSVASQGQVVFKSGRAGFGGMGVFGTSNASDGEASDSKNCGM